MSESRVLVYDSKDQSRTYEVPLLQLVRASLTQLLRVRLDDVFIELTLLSVPSDLELTGQPRLVNLDPDYGYTYVKVMAGNRVLYKHPHPLEDVVTMTLQSVLRKLNPEITEWYYLVDVPGLRRVTVERPTPEVQGAIRIPAETPVDRPRFGVRRLAEEAPQEAAISDFKAAREPGQFPGRVKIVMQEELHDNLVRRRDLSLEIEEGGFLVGRVFKDAEVQDGWILEITGALDAEQTGASLLHFTFTGDSFTAVKQVLRHQRPGERLLGWFHTHLFPATDSMGLSSIDYTLHFQTFTIAWQLAGLINIDGPDRVLRFYMRERDEMVQCPVYRIGGKTSAGRHSTGFQGPRDTINQNEDGSPADPGQPNSVKPIPSSNGEVPSAPSGSEKEST